MAQRITSQQFLDANTHKNPCCCWKKSWILLAKNVLPLLTLLFQDYFAGFQTANRCCHLATSWYFFLPAGSSGKKTLDSSISERVIWSLSDSVTSTPPVSPTTVRSPGASPPVAPKPIYLRTSRPYWQRQKQAQSSGVGVGRKREYPSGKPGTLVYCGPCSGLFSVQHAVPVLILCSTSQS